MRVVRSHPNPINFIILILSLGLVLRNECSLTSDNNPDEASGEDHDSQLSPPTTSHKIRLINPDIPYNYQSGIPSWDSKPKPGKPHAFKFHNLPPLKQQFHSEPSNVLHEPSNLAPHKQQMTLSEKPMVDEHVKNLTQHEPHTFEFHNLPPLKQELLPPLKKEPHSEPSIVLHEKPTVDEHMNNRIQHEPTKVKGRTFTFNVSQINHASSNDSSTNDDVDHNGSNLKGKIKIAHPLDRSTSDANITDGDLSAFSNCSSKDCSLICAGTKLAKCDQHSDKICLCPAFKFIPVAAEVEGAVRLENLEDASEAACGESCIARSSYARVLIKKNGTKECICLTNQTSNSGITYCDRSANVDVCNRICQSSAATCAFSGICLCRDNWPSVFNLSVPNVRKEIASDHSECSKRCSLYHHDFVGRIYDPHISDVSIKSYHFESKYCLCGPESFILTNSLTKEIIAAGFHICSGLKCKQRCGMRDAICEPEHRRACLCNHQNIFIGNFLWSRLPSHAEKFCQDACYAHKLSARVIERNPLLVPSSERFQPWYRKSMFLYEYDGKFCHCIKVDLEMSQFRPCTGEICRWLCGHSDAVCDVESRRACICNTHKLIGGLGRKSDSGEINCDISCRHHLMDAEVIDVIWDTTQLDGWGVPKSKFCGCIQATTSAGLSHCDGGDGDNCPKYCNNSEAYCTREKYCDCGVNNHHRLNKGAVRLPTGPELEECGEKCRSWMWPFAEDLDNSPFIYDEGRFNCSQTNSCPPVHTKHWDPNTVGFHVERSLHEEIELAQSRKFCLCSKTVTVHYNPGTRVLPQLAPYKAPHDLECIGNHICTVVGNSVHIK